MVLQGTFSEAQIKNHNATVYKEGGVRWHDMTCCDIMPLSIHFS